MRRRTFLKTSGLLLAASAAGIPAEQPPQPQSSSIIFHWESLPQDTYPKTPEEKQRVETLILEAASEFNTKRYVQEPLDLLHTSSPLEVYFNEKEEEAVFYPLPLKRIMNFNTLLFLSEGQVLSRGFHEASHFYDREKGLMEVCIEIQEEFLALHYRERSQEAFKSWCNSTTYNQKYFLKAERELCESEIRACSRGLSYNQTLQARQWESPLAWIMCQTQIFACLKKEEHKLEYINKQISQG